MLESLVHFDTKYAVLWMKDNSIRMTITRNHNNCFNNQEMMRSVALFAVPRLTYIAFN